MIIAPVGVAAGWLADRGHRAAPVLALAPSLFAMYTYGSGVLLVVVAAVLVVGAGMAWSMQLNGDPSITAAIAIGSTLLPLASSVFAYFLYRPLFQQRTPTSIQFAATPGELASAGRSHTTLFDAASTNSAADRPISSPAPPWSELTRADG